MQGSGGARLFRSIGSWILDQVVERWFPIALTVSGGVLVAMTTLSDLFGEYGFLVSGAVAVVFVLLMSIVYWIISMAQDRFAEARYKQILASSPPSSVNPLRTDYSGEVIKLADFRTHEMVHAGKAFRGCHIHGPGTMVLLSSCSLWNPTMIGCDLVYWDEIYKIRTPIGFTRCTFEQCHFIGVTLFIPRAGCEAIEKGTAPKSEAPSILGWPPVANKGGTQ
jgi:hypothetical protein